MPFLTLEQGAMSLAGRYMGQMFVDIYKQWTDWNEMKKNTTNMEGVSSLANGQSMRFAGEQNAKELNLQGLGSTLDGSSMVGSTAAQFTTEFIGERKAAPFREQAENASAVEAMANRMATEGRVGLHASEQPNDPNAAANAARRSILIHNHENVLGTRLTTEQRNDLERTHNAGEIKTLHDNAVAVRKDATRRSEGISGRYNRRAQYMGNLGQALGKYANGGTTMAASEAKQQAAYNSADAELFSGTRQMQRSANDQASSGQQNAEQQARLIIDVMGFLAQANRS